jgi:hypothetical protein
VASTVGAFTLYRPDQTLLDEKEKTIDSLNMEIYALRTQLSNLIANQTQSSNTQNEIAVLNNRLTELGNEYASLQRSYAAAQQVIRLEVSKIIYNGTVKQEVDHKTSIYKSEINELAAGYVFVEAQSNSTSTYVQIKYSYTYDNKNMPFEYTVPLGEKGTALLPILPATLEIFVGNENAEDDNEVKAIVTLYY